MISLKNQATQSVFNATLPDLDRDLYMCFEMKRTKNSQSTNKDIRNTFGLLVPFSVGISSAVAWGCANNPKGN